MLDQPSQAGCAQENGEAYLHNVQSISQEQGDEEISSRKGGLIALGFEQGAKEIIQGKLLEFCIRLLMWVSRINF